MENDSSPGQLSGKSLLSDTDQSLHRLNQLLRVVANTVFENYFNLLDVGDSSSWISFHYHQNGLLPRCDRTNARIFAKKLCTIEARNLNRLDRSETCFNQQLY